MCIHSSLNPSLNSCHGHDIDIWLKLTLGAFLGKGGVKNVIRQSSTVMQHMCRCIRLSLKQTIYCQGRQQDH